MKKIRYTGRKRIRYKHKKVRILWRFYTLHKRQSKYDHTHASQKRLPRQKQITKWHQELLRVVEKAVESGHVKFTHGDADVSFADIPDTRLSSIGYDKSVNTEHSRWIHNTDTTHTDNQTIGEQFQQTFVTLVDALVQLARTSGF